MTIHNIRPIPPQHGLPIVGQPIEIINWYPTVQIVCKCKGQPLLIVGLDAVTTCPQCQHSYRVERLTLDRATNECSLSVARVVLEPIAISAPPPIAPDAPGTH